MKSQKNSVLVLDDDPIVTDYLKYSLQRMSFEPTVVHNSTILDTKKIHSFRYVILDLWMSDTFGTEALDKLIAADFKGGVILITGFLTDRLPEIASYGSRKGLTILGVLEKPFPEQGLARLLDPRLMGGQPYAS